MKHTHTPPFDRIREDNRKEANGIGIKRGRTRDICQSKGFQIYISQPTGEFEIIFVAAFIIINFTFLLDDYEYYLLVLLPRVAVARG